MLRSGSFLHTRRLSSPCTMGTSVPEKSMQPLSANSTLVRNQIPPNLLLGPGVNEGMQCEDAGFIQEVAGG